MSPTLAVHLTEQRPRTRGDCEGGERPCPWIGCAHHLLAEAAARLPEERVLELLDELPDTCALDVADRGGETLEGCGARLVTTDARGKNAGWLGQPVTREFARQIETKGLRRLARRPGLEALAADGSEPWAWAGRSGAEPEPPAGVERPYRRQWSPAPKTTETTEEETTVDETDETPEPTEDTSPAEGPRCARCKGPRGEVRSNTPAAHRKLCPDCRRHERSVAAGRKRRAAEKAPPPARRPRVSSPAPRPVQAPASAATLESVLEHARRCVALVERLGGVERAEGLAAWLEAGRAA